jgi:hypothetical protein
MDRFVPPTGDVWEIVELETLVASPRAEDGSDRCDGYARWALCRALTTVHELLDQELVAGDESNSAARSDDLGKAVDANDSTVSVDREEGGDDWAVGAIWSDLEEAI